MPSILLRSSLPLPLLAALALLVPSGVRAAPPADPAQVVTGFVNSLGDMARNHALNDGERELEFGRILDWDCDLSRIADYALGAYATKVSDSDRKDYDKLFERWVTHAFANRLGGFDSASFHVKSVAKADDGVLVASEIVDGNRPIEIDWHVSAGSGGYRIVDVAMEGISMAQVEREEMGAVLRRNGGTVASLTRVLEERIAGNDAAAPAPAAAPAASAATSPISPASTAR